jgi:hypothetical protein
VILYLKKQQYGRNGRVGWRILLKQMILSLLQTWYQRHSVIDSNGNIYVDFPFADIEGKATTISGLSFFKRIAPVLIEVQRQANDQFKYK